MYTFILRFEKVYSDLPTSHISLVDNWLFMNKVNNWLFLHDLSKASLYVQKLHRKDRLSFKKAKPKRNT